MKISRALVMLMVLFVAASAFALEKRAFQIKEDYDTEPLSDCMLQYYYYIPCPTYSWFWAFTGWDHGDIIGEWFEIGDMSMGGFGACSPVDCHVIDQLRVLDFAGYGQTHPGLFTVEFDIYCADEYGCPVGPSLWNSGRRETGFAWNYISVDPPVTICGCAINPGPPPSRPRVLVTVTHTGSNGIYPAWGTDNIATPLRDACDMHDVGCMPALHPRPYSNHYPAIHSGFYGQGFAYCPPRAFLDGRDTSPDGSQFGAVELAWRVYLLCTGPTASEPAT
ncbi:MAG: hypothetical protein ABIJ00_05230 [Candidatus Eisenbacteria bacterium]